MAIRPGVTHDGFLNTYTFSKDDKNPSPLEPVPTSQTQDPKHTIPIELDSYL